MDLQSSRILGAALLVVACSTQQTPEPVPTVDHAIIESFVDDVQGPAFEHEVRGVLAFINRASEAELDLPAPEGAGLDVRAARGIIAAQPIETVEELDAVPYVGIHAWSKLTERACDLQGLCEPEMDLWSWNIENFPNSTQAPGDVEDLINALDPTIVGFQEIGDRDVFNATMERLPNHHGFVGRNRWRDTRVAIAYRTDRVEVEEIEDLFEDDSWAFPRPPLAVTFSMRGRAGSGRFTVVVVHLKARGDAESVMRRRAAIERLDLWIDDHRLDVTENVFVVGDYNDAVDDPAEENVFGPFRAQDYSILTATLAEEEAYSYIPSRWRGLIDHLVSTDHAQRVFPVQDVEALAVEEMSFDYVERVSDHRPVRSRHVPILVN